jgi:hypothetical protein
MDLNKDDDSPSPEEYGLPEGNQYVRRNAISGPSSGSYDHTDVRSVFSRAELDELHRSQNHRSALQNSNLTPPQWSEIFTLRPREQSSHHVMGNSANPGNATHDSPAPGLPATVDVEPHDDGAAGEGGRRRRHRQR